MDWKTAAPYIATAISTFITWFFTQAQTFGTASKIDTAHAKTDLTVREHGDGLAAKIETLSQTVNALSKDFSEFKTESAIHIDNQNENLRRVCSKVGIEWIEPVTVIPAEKK